MQREFPLSDLYHLDMPQYNKHSCRRVASPIGINLPTRCLAAEVVKLQSDVQDGGGPSHATNPDFGPNYNDHPIVINARSLQIPEQLIRPVALYWDGVQYNKKQGFVGMFLHDLKADKRHLIFIIRVALRLVTPHKSTHTNMSAPCPPL
jgi:hypothetical protein